MHDVPNETDLGTANVRPQVCYSVFVTRNDEYPLLIHRQPRLSTAISRSEWMRIVNSDPSLHLTNEISAIWKEGELPFEFNAEYGYISLGNPTPHGVEKALDIAEVLGAHLRGGDGEFYLSADDYYFPPDDATPDSRPSNLSLLLGEHGELLVIASGVIGYLIPRTLWRDIDGWEDVVSGILGVSAMLLTKLCLDRRKSN